MFTKQKLTTLGQEAFIMLVVFLALIYCADITKVFAAGGCVHPTADGANGGFAQELFTDVPYDEDIYARLEKEKQDPTIVRGRCVRVRFDYLVNKDIPHGAEAIKLNLFYDVSHTAIKERMEKRSAKRYTWFGHVKDVKNSQAILVVEDDTVTGNVTIEGNMYQIRPVCHAGTGRKISDGIHIICEIDQSVFPEEVPPIPAETPDTSDIVPPTSQADGVSIIDVMVVYTDDVATASGNIAAEIQLAIDETNQSYANSGINQRLRLVHSQEVVYDETGDMFTDLNCITLPSDSCLDQIHEWRDTYGADVVCLWVEDGGSFCGLAWLMTTPSNAFESSAFSVVDRGCATGNFTFGHELGHNMGATHDRDNTSIQGAFPYSFGYQDPGGEWRTIMANNCPGGCPRIQYWSNPDVTFGNVPMGVRAGEPDAADNRKTLNNTALTVVEFRPTAVPLTTPDVKVNGSDETVAQIDNLSVTVSLDPGNSAGVNADWWVAAEVSGTSTIDGWYYFDLRTFGFVFAGNSLFDLPATYQGSLSIVTTFQVLNISVSGLPSGRYIFYFGVDMNMNGLLDLGRLYYDGVVVNITS